MARVGSQLDPCHLYTNSACYNALGFRLGLGLGQGLGLRLWLGLLLGSGLDWPWGRVDCNVWRVFCVIPCFTLFFVVSMR